jgi:hypothetical protein
MFFEGLDAGVGPGQARPNSDTADASFTAAASLLAKVKHEDFEGLPIGNFSTLSVSPELNVTLTNTDQRTPLGFHYGITTEPDPTIYSASDILKYGFNTTANGSQFLAFAPKVDIGTASVQFDFTDPSHAFGAYLTGLGTSGGSLHAVFTDSAGGTFDRVVTGSTIGGVQFFGFTDTADFQSVVLQMRGVQGGNRDVFGIDDVRFTSPPPSTSPIPEPSAYVLVALGGLLLAGRLVSARRFARRVS